MKYDKVIVFLISTSMILLSIYSVTGIEDKKIVSSTISDVELTVNDEIIKIGKFYGCETPFVRPADLAKDDTPGIEPVVHAIETIPEKYDYIVLLQPTSPLRTTEDVDGCIHFCIKNSANACVSITETEKSPGTVWWRGSKKTSEEDC